MKIVKAGVIDAPIEKVFKCLIDINFYKADIKRQIKNEDIYLKVQYDRNDPFGIGKTITFLVNDIPVYFMKVLALNTPFEIEMDINLSSDTEAIFGNFKYTAKLNSIEDNKTQYTYTYSSIKDPSHWLTKFLVAIAKIYFSVSLGRTNKHFASYVEATNI